MAKKITCIKKASGDHENSYTAITSLTWSEGNNTGTYTRLQMYDYVKDDSRFAYVEDSSGNKAYLMAATTSKGTKYVKTKPDDVKSDNLLKLPECK